MATYSQYRTVAGTVKESWDESARIIIQNDELYGRQTSLLRLGCVCQTEVGIEAELMALG